MRTSSLDAHARLVLAIALALSACDTPAYLQRAAFRRVQRVIEAVIMRP